MCQGLLWYKSGLLNRGPLRAFPKFEIEKVSSDENKGKGCLKDKLPLLFLDKKQNTFFHPHILSIVISTKSGHNYDNICSVNFMSYVTISPMLIASNYGPLRG